MDHYPKNKYSRLVDPVDGMELSYDGDGLSAAGRRYEITDGIADLMVSGEKDKELSREIDVFENLPIEGICYFTGSIFDKTLSLLSRFLPSGRDNLSCVEIGGGEGYFARAFKDRFPAGNSYVCDISRKHLNLAPDNLIKIRCDARKPFLEKGSVDVAVFWVSLHHFASGDLALVLRRAADMLTENGVIMIFEPNGIFLPRRALLATPLKKLVYYDEEEKAVDIGEIDDIINGFGYKSCYRAGCNPHYNRAFLKKLAGGWLFYPALEIMYWMECLFAGRNFGETRRWPLSLSLYALGLWTRKQS